MQPSLSAGVILQNRYRLSGILGQGGFGRTYLGEDLGRFNERCAIKEFIPSQGGENALAKSRELFRREAEILYQISHPQIPQFRATFEENQRLFIVQDYVAGKTYRELLNERKAQRMMFSEAEGLQLLRQLLPVLAHIHARGIIHRDIAPDNIILRQSDYLPVLIDFGVVKAIATQIQLQGTDEPNVTTVGKLGYAPSEQMQTGRAYPNSDLYALAVTVMVLMTGREPQELYDDIHSTWHWSHYIQINPSFGAVLTRMLSYRPGDRFQSVSDVAKALQGLSGSPTAQTIVPPPFSPPTEPQQTLPPFPPPAAQAPDLSQMQTVAVGRRAIPTAATGMTPTAAVSQRAPSSRSAPPTAVASAPAQTSIWDNPLAVFGMGLGLAIITGITAVAVVSALLNLQSPTSDPTPSVSATPSPLPSATPSASPTPSPSPSATPDEPVVFDQRVSLDPGSQTTLRGTLRKNQAINYVITLEAEDSLIARLEADNLVMSVLDANQQPLEGASVDVGQWEGSVPEAGEYILHLTPIGDAEQVDYALNLRREGAAPSPSPEPSPEEPSPVPSEVPTPDIEVDRETLNLDAGTKVEVTDQVRSDRIKRYLVALSPGQVLTVEVLQGDVSINLREPAGQPTGQVSGGSGRVEAASSGRYQIDVFADQTVNFALRVGVD